MSEHSSGPNDAAVLVSQQHVVLEQRPMPTYGPSDVLLRVDAVGICGSDVHYFKEGRIGSYVVDAPLILGHETAATVVALGAEVDESLLGARVVIEPGVPCRTCDWCRHGSYNLCSDVAFHATPPVDGTLQRFVSMPADYVFELPDSIDQIEGALVEPLAVAVWACRKAEVAVGSRVLVTGAGPVGLLVAQVARVFGAREVAVTDVDRAKLELATKLGASEIYDAQQFSGEPRFDVHIECSGSATATLDGLRSLRRLGISVLVGMGAAEVAIPVSLIQERELRITGVFRYANCFPLAIQLLESGQVQVKPLISRRYDLKDSEEAIELAALPGVLKVLVEMNTSREQRTVSTGT